MFQIRSAEDLHEYKKNTIALKNSCSYNVDLQDPLGNTLLHLCSIKNNIELTKALLQDSANYNLKNVKGLSPIFYVTSIDMFKVYYDNIGSKIFTLTTEDTKENIITYLDKSKDKNISQYILTLKN